MRTSVIGQLALIAGVVGIALRCLPHSLSRSTMLGAAASRGGTFVFQGHSKVTVKVEK